MDPPRTPESSTAADPVWRVGDVAAFWQRDPRTIWRWVKAGRHPAPRTDPGGQPYWLAADVHGFAAVPTDDDRPLGRPTSGGSALRFPLTVG